MATLEASVRLPAFLRLPAEICNTIFRYAMTCDTLYAGKTWRNLDLDPGSTYEEWRNEDKIWPCLKPLLICKQIHREASYILYRYGRFFVLIAVNEWESISPRAPTGYYEIFRKYPKHIARIRNLEIYIQWHKIVHNPSHWIWDTPARWNDLAVTWYNCRFYSLRKIQIQWYCTGDGSQSRTLGVIPDNHAEGPEKFGCCRKILLPLLIFHARRPDLSMEVQIGPWCEKDKNHLEGQYIPVYKDFEDYVRDHLGGGS